MAILIVYWTGSGNTGLLADGIKKGIEKAGVEAHLRFVSDITPVEASRYDKIALGCPSMSAEQLEEFEFEPFYNALKDDLAGKKIILYGSYGWGDGEWMRTWQEDVVAHGGILVAEGLIALETPDIVVMKAAEKLGEAFAKA